MIVPDTNMLLYAYDAKSPYHSKAAEWWRQCLSGNEEIGLPHVVIFAFLRIATNPRVYAQPMTCTQAADRIRSWLKQPIARVLEPSAAAVEQTIKLLEFVGTAANLVTDAQIAVITMEHDATVHTTDTDFSRFPGLRWWNPITGAKASPRRGK